MTNENRMDDVTAAILKECYDMAALYERFPAARTILSSKAESVPSLQDCTPTVDEEPEVYVSEMQIITDVMQMLSGNRAGMPESVQISWQLLDSLPDSGEKQYCLALMALNRGDTQANRLESLRHTSIALGYVPDDPRYKALAEILSGADR